MSIVTVPEFRNYLSGARISETQKLSAQAILDGVQSDLEVHLNRSVQQRRTKEIVALSETGNAHVHNSPIAALYGVYGVDVMTQEPDEHPIPLSAYAWLPGRSFIRVGYLARGGLVAVDYLGGMNGDKIPGLKLAIMRVAAREYTHNHDDGMSIQNTELRPPEDPTPVAKGWQPEELARYDRYRRRTLV